MTRSLWNGSFCVHILVLLLAVGLIVMVPTSSTFAQEDDWGDFGDDDAGGDFGDDFGDGSGEDEWGDDASGDDFDDFGDSIDEGDSMEEPDRKISVYNPLYPDKDPFFPIVFQKPKQVRRPTKQVGKIDKRPVPEVVPEINLNVLCIVGNAGKRMALLEFQGTPQEMAAGDEVEGNFKIMEIKEDAVEIYSYRTRRRKTFKIGG